MWLAAAETSGIFEKFCIERCLSFGVTVAWQAFSLGCDGSRLRRFQIWKLDEASLLARLQPSTKWPRANSRNEAAALGRAQHREAALQTRAAGRIAGLMILINLLLVSLAADLL